MTEPAPAMSARMSAIEERGRTVLMPTYGRQPVALREGRGCRVTDVDGREYLDMIGGLAVSVLGHARIPPCSPPSRSRHPGLVHVSNLVRLRAAAGCRREAGGHGVPQPRLLLQQRCRGGRGRHQAGRQVGSCTAAPPAPSSAPGGPSTDARWGRSPRPRTGATATLRAAARGFVHVAYDDLSAVAGAVDGSTVAVLMEPIEGELGVVPMSDDTLRGLRRLCDEKDLLLILDEVQTGMGRTGRWWAHQHAGIVPDVMTVAKGLAAGLPIGAVLAGPRADVLALATTAPPSAEAPDDVGGRGGHRRHRPRRARRELGACR